MKNILIPIDFSAESERVLASAFELAKATQSALHIVHILDDGYSPDATLKGGSKYLQNGKDEIALMQRVSERREKLLKTVRRYDNELVEIACSVETGGFKEAMRRILQSMEVRLVIMGRNSEAAISDLYPPGDETMSKEWDETPLLIIEDNVFISKLSELTILFDLGPYDPKIVRRLKSFAQTFEMHISVAHLSTYGEVKNGTIEEQLRQFVSDNQLVSASTHIFGYNESISSVKDLLKSRDIHLVANISQEKDALTRIFAGGDLDKVIDSVRADVFDLQ